MLRQQLEQTHKDLAALRGQVDSTRAFQVLIATELRHVSGAVEVWRGISMRYIKGKRNLGPTTEPSREALESHEVIELQTFSKRKAWIEEKIRACSSFI